MPGMMALLLAVAGEAAAQAYHPASLDRLEQAPPGERRAERFGPLERSEGWRLYGRFGLLNFQNEPDPNGSGYTGQLAPHRPRARHENLCRHPSPLLTLFGEDVTYITGGPPVRR